MIPLTLPQEETPKTCHEKRRSQCLCIDTDRPFFESLASPMGDLKGSIWRPDTFAHDRGLDRVSRINHSDSGSLDDSRARLIPDEEALELDLRALIACKIQNRFTGRLRAVWPNCMPLQTDDEWRSEPKSEAWPVFHRVW